ncbi:MAG: hypothetical protein GY854_32860 [Deltaproteobacteria bacterium]|nr:hypothetical protein [Deltaproteobacteria bacterium]
MTIDNKKNTLPSQGLLGAGLFILSASVLALELLGMRLLSFALWHHLAYMVLSVAMLGFGASGAWLASSVKERDPRKVITWSAILFSATNVVGFIILSHVRLDTFEMSSFKLVKLGFYYVVLLVPYFFAGLAVAAIFRSASEKTTSLYCINLAGSGVGCLLFMYLITPLGGPGALFAVSSLGMVSAFLWSFKEKSKIRIVAVCGLVAICALVPFADKLVPLQSAVSKSLARHLQLPGAEIEFTEWTPLSRIDVVRAPKAFNAFLGEWRSGDQMRTITIDGDANTWVFSHPLLKRAIELKEQTGGSLAAIAEQDESKKENITDILRINEYALAFHIKPNEPEVLIIGAGGGNEVAVALAAGSKHVTGVELNPAIMSQSTHHLKDFFGGLYESERATPVISEGRNFVRRTDKFFDIIQMSGVDTWSGLSSGAYVLSENYLYTVEAIKDYIARLKPDGLLSVGRFRLEPPRESLRNLTNALRALKELGVKNPHRHVAVISYGPPNTARLLVKKSPFTREEVEFYLKLVAESKARESRIWYVPYFFSRFERSPFIEAIDAVVRGPEIEQHFYDKYPYDVSPVYDDKPFFFEYYKWKNFLIDRKMSGSGGQVGASRPVGLTILTYLLLQVFVLCLVFIFVPLLRLRRRGVFLPHKWKVAGGFGALGLAFMFVEVGLMQKLSLCLGHPVYSISVSLVAVLFGSGLGSLVAGRLPMAEEKRVVLALISVVAIIVVYIFALEPLSNAVLALSMGTGRIIVGLLVAVLAFPMGMPFPLSLQKAGTLGPAVVPWAWGINGGASVLGSILCIVVAMAFGFKIVLAVAAVLYLIAIPILFALMKAKPYTAK